MLADSGSLRLQQGRQCRPGGKQAGNHIADRLADQGGRALRLARGLHQAAHGLNNDVVGRAVGQRAGLAEAGDADIHQPGIEGAQRFGADAQALGHARPEVLDHHIDLPGQLMHHGDRIRMFEVQHQALLVAIHDREQGALPILHGADGAVVVALGRLHLHDFRAQIGQQGRGHGARQNPGEVQDADAVQRTGGSFFG